MNMRYAMLMVVSTACTSTSHEPPPGAPSDGGPDIDGSVSDDAGADTPDPIDIHRSGTRLKVKVLNSSDGAKVFQAMHDTDRDEDCAFQLASDGTTRCLPTSIAHAGTYFANSSCTTPLAAVFVGCTAPAYVSVPVGSSCATSPGQGARVFLRNPTLFSSYYVKSAGTCSGPHPASGFALVGPTGSEIPPSSFVEATVAIE